MSEVSAGKLWGLRRLAADAGLFRMLAVDRPLPIEHLVAAARGTTDAAYDDVGDVASLVVRHLAPHASAVLLDPHYAYPAAIAFADPARGLVLALEDSVVAETPRGRRSAALHDWSVEKIKRAGGDAVKVLAWYRPDADPDVLRHQQDFVAAIGADCVRWDIPFVLEPAIYPFPDDPAHATSYVEHTARRAEMVIASAATFAHPRYHVDVVALESPVPAGRVPDPDSGDAAALGTTQGLFDELGAAAGRPWVAVAAGATGDEFRRILVFAYRAGASGYLAGGTVWGDACRRFPDHAAIAAELDAGVAAYMAELNGLTAELALPWPRHERFGGGPRLRGAGPGFRSEYLDVGRR